MAAAACVLGLFEPLSLPGLYPKRTVRLVDGGVYDNQGVASLLEQDCTILLVSDASGQIKPKPRPSGGPFGVVVRTNDMPAGTRPRLAVQRVCHATAIHDATRVDVLAR